MELSGRVALVTGASSGVGRATALALARRGARVVVNYARSEDGARETVAAIEAAGGEAVAVRADIGSDAECRELVEATVRTFGALHGLVNNAGTTRFIPHDRLDEVREEDWSEIFRVNVQGTFACTRAAAPHLRASGNGAVVNVASTAGLRGHGSSIPYAASKAAVITMTRSLARVLAPEIRVNCIAPGFIEGRWLREGLGEAVYGPRRQAVAAATPLGGVATPERCAESIVALIADHGFVTGQTVIVDGGFSL